MIIYDVDTQNDFICENGALSIPNATEIVDTIKDVIDFGITNKIKILGSVDSHDEDDAEFKDFPKHCVKNTWGQKKIDGTVSDDCVFIERTQNAPNLNEHKQIYLEKQTYNIWSENLGQPENLLKLLSQISSNNQIFVMGVATDICVISAVRGFVTLGYEVFVITDAIKGLDGESQAIQEMKDSGVQFISCDEFKAICVAQK